MNITAEKEQANIAGIKPILSGNERKKRFYQLFQKSCSLHLLRQSYAQNCCFQKRICDHHTFHFSKLLNIEFDSIISRNQYKTCYSDIADTIHHAIKKNSVFPGTEISKKHISMDKYNHIHRNNTKQFMI